MKGVILAGGTATRLRPLSLATNKHLMPIYDKPVIYYAIEKLLEADIDRIMIITSPQFLQGFVELLGSGQNFISKKTGRQIQITYGIQNEASGIAEGLYIAKDYVGTENCVLYLGDNIFEDTISEHVKNFTSGASLFLKQVSDPERFGVATVNSAGSVISLEEKPTHPTSSLAAIGVYLYDNTVFDKMVGQPKSDRGEYEITYINNLYLQEKKLRAVELTGAWFDVGTFDSLLAAANYMQEKRKGSQ